MVWESLYLSLSFLLVEVKPINTNHFKVNNSAAFSTVFTALYNHRLSLVPKHFHPPKGSPTAGSCHSRLFRGLWQPPTCFVPPWSAYSGYGERNEQAKCKCGRGEDPDSPPPSVPLPPPGSSGCVRRQHPCRLSSHRAGGVLL